MLVAVGCLLCHSTLVQPEIHALWKEALHGGYVTPLCRDEVVQTHPFVLQFFDGMKGYSKHANEVKTWQQEAISTW